MTESSVSIQYTEAFLGFLARRGLPHQYYFRDHQPLGGNGALGRVSSRHFCELVRWGVQQLGDPAIGLQFGGSIGGRGFGLLGIASASANTLAGSIGSLAKMESLTSTLGKVNVVRQGNIVHLRWKSSERALPPTLIEGIIAGWASFGRYLLNEQAPIHSVSFRHGRLASMASYEDAFACGVGFDAKWDEISVSAELLEAKTKFGDSELHHALMRWSNDSTMVASAERTSLVRRIVDLIDARLPLAAISQDEVAHEFGMSRRSLQRSLHGAGLNYRRLLDCVRGKLAINAVSDSPKSFMRVAERIGYAEQASFCHSFRRWAGVAPSEFVRTFTPQFFAPREIGRSPCERAGSPNAKLRRY